MKKPSSMPNRRTPSEVNSKTDNQQNTSESKSAEKTFSIPPNPEKFSYRVGDKLEIRAEVFEEIRRFIDEELEKRPPMHPFMEIRDHESMRFWNIKQLLDKVHAQNVELGNATPRDILDRELQEDLARINKNREL